MQASINKLHSAVYMVACPATLLAVLLATMPTCSTEPAPRHTTEPASSHHSIHLPVSTGFTTAAVATRPNGGLLVAGVCQEQTEGMPEALQKACCGCKPSLVAFELGLDGKVGQAWHLGHANRMEVRDLVVFKDGSLSVTGTVGGIGRLGSKDGPSKELGAGAQDLFLARFSPDMELVWAQQLGEQDDDRGLSLSLLPSGGAILAGGYQGVLRASDAPDESLRVSGTNDAGYFLGRFDATGKLAWFANQDLTGPEVGVAAATALPDGSVVLTGVAGGPRAKVPEGPWADQKTCKRDLGYVARYGPKGGNRPNDPVLNPTR